MTSRDREIAQLAKEIDLLKRRLEKYEILAGVVQKAEIWDYALYNEKPGEEWVALDRRDYQRIMQVLFQLDLMKPWQTSIERRLGRY